MLTVAEQLMHNTVRLECDLKDGTVSNGTSFFFQFDISGKPCVSLVTNKHVIEGATECRFMLTRQNANGYPVVGSFVEVRLGINESHWTPHPDPSVDQAILGLGDVVRAAEAQSFSPYINAIGEDLVPSDDFISALGGMDDITMVGYPNAVWDAANNLPILRRGITATSLKTDYNGCPEFLIDCACFNGSSGSPVYIFNNGFFIDEHGIPKTGIRLKLIGVLYAGHFIQAKGSVIMKKKRETETDIPINLGVVVKTRKLLEFRDVIQKLWR